jgi:hypothetical protein
LGCSYERRAPKLALDHNLRGIVDEIEVKYMHEVFTRNKRGQFIGQGGHMTHSRWRQFVLFSILSAPVMNSCESIEGQMDVPITGVGINRCIRMSGETFFLRNAACNRFIRLGQVKNIIAKHSRAEANRAIDAFQFRVSPFDAADAIRDYCGEEVAFLFHFLAFLQCVSHSRNVHCLFFVDRMAETGTGLCYLPSAVVCFHVTCSISFSKKAATTKKSETTNSSAVAF